MTEKPVYRCPLTGQLYPDGTAIFCRVNGECGSARKGVLMWCASGAWKVLSKRQGEKSHGEILTIATTGRAIAPQSIRKAHE
jgi:hypothetical protein